ncbi:MAG: formyltransferase family protein [bacterium]|nr:formyltransferase family protein [bacterium]
MVRIGYFGYRGWAFALLDRLLSGIDPTKSNVVLVGTVEYREESLDYHRYANLQFINPKDGTALEESVRSQALTLALFYGWSWMVPDALTQRLDCLCLHPSLLPKYRGGTPFQHQILNGETEGGLTIFKMTDVLDGGPILRQRRFSLAGTLREILARVVDEGATATLEIIRQYEAGRVAMTPQTNLDRYPPYRRRKPSESELTLTQLAEMSTHDFYNFVRALDDPFPNCFIHLSPTEKLLVKEIRIVDDVPSGSVLFDETTASVGDATVVRLRDGYARLVRYALTEEQVPGNLAERATTK